jgi:SAM-dependent methyltransferase
MPSLYDDPVLYDAVSPPGPYLPFYVDQARRREGSVLELACGTGQLIVPIAQTGARAVGLDLSPTMLEAARARADAEAVSVDWVAGDMRRFVVHEQFSMIFVARNSLLQLTSTDDLRACLASIRQHLRPDARFVFDVFNPDVQILGSPKDRRRPVRSFQHPSRGEVALEMTSDYDSAQQVNKATWYFSTSDERDFLVVPLHLRSIFPQELPLLLAAEGLVLEERWGDFDGRAFGAESRLQVCIARHA